MVGGTNLLKNQDFLVVTENLVTEKSMTYDNWQGRIEYLVDYRVFKSILEND